MCIIAAIPTGKEVSKETLERCWKNNPQGGGFAYIENQKIQIVKELKSFKRFYQKYEEAKFSNPESSFIVHFRISTHGKVNEANCHPFYVNDKLAFAHNGIISNAPESKNFSDTVMFNESILKALPDGFIHQNHFKELIKAYIGYGSKLAFLDINNNIHLINEKAGVWDDGIWWSNGGYKQSHYYDYGGQKRDYKPTGGQNYSKASYQPSLGFASATFPRETIDSSKFNDKVADRMNMPLGRLKTDNLSHLNDGINNKYLSYCPMCDEPLQSYNERMNGVCRKCTDKYSVEWAL